MNYLGGYMRYLIALVLSLLIISCDDEENITGGGQDFPETPTHPIYYQYEFTDYDNGPIHNGWFIDNQGAVRSFNFTSNDYLWYDADAEGYISEDNFLSNFNQQNTIIDQIDMNELSSMNKYVDGLESIMSEEYQIDSTGGTANFYAYRWDDDRQMYKRITIGQGGDFNVVNLMPGAAELSDWMMGIGQKHSPFVWE
jgi:hypothetical protein